MIDRFKLAEWLHERFCHQNHIDYCGWYYRSQDIDKWDNVTYQYWLKRADVLIEYLRNCNVAV